MTDIEYTFSSPNDARSYLREIGLLWSAWVIGLMLVLSTHGVTLLIVAVVLFAALLLLARPLLPRTERLVPENKREGGAVETVLRGGTTRDRVLRELAYGAAPMAAALQTAGLSSSWVAARHIVVALTLLAFVFVLVVPLV
jgi:hypothetical protein